MFYIASVHVLYYWLCLQCLPQQAGAQESVVTTITVASPTPSPSTYLSSSLFESTILNSTNTFRYQHEVLAVVWNKSLASIASAWSQECHFAHSGTKGIGENIAEGFVQTTFAVDAWGDERAEYDFNDPGYSEATGHFTQLVWESTTSTGCAATFCNGTNNVSGWLLVCEYYPPGNIIGQGSSSDEYFIENVHYQTTTAQMPNGWEQTATASSTSTVAIATTTTSTYGLTVVPTTISSSATAGMQSSGNAGYSGHSDLALRFWLTVSAITVATIIVSIGFC